MSAAAIPWLRVAGALVRGRAPGQAVIQYSDACNASCGHCGMSVKNSFPRSKLTPDKVKPLLDLLAARGVMAVSFTGGEPLLYLDEIAQCVRHARSLGMRSVRTGSNGFFLRGWDKPGFRDRVEKYADALAGSGCTAFWISLDASVALEHERHRGLAGVVEGMRQGLPIFHERGLYPAANLCINRRMDGRDRDGDGAPGQPFDPRAFYERFRRAFIGYFGFAAELGFTSANVCYPMLGESFGQDQVVYQAAGDEAFIRFAPKERVPLYKALFDAVTLFRPRLRIFTPKSALRAMIASAEGRPETDFPCRGGLDFFFIDAAGMRVFPCGFRGSEDLTEAIAGKKPIKASGKNCRLCDWECFRDPSRLFGPMLELAGNPLALVKRAARDPAWARLWWEDMRYLRACGWFDGSKPPRLRAMAARAKVRPPRAGFPEEARPVR